MNEPKPGMKRISVRTKKCPNPLFEEWLEEWQKEAASKGMDMQYCFGKALRSLRKYPLLLKSGRECAVLENFGDRLCFLLDHKLAEYRKKNPEAFVTTPEMESEAVNDDTGEVVPSKKKKANQKGKKGSNDGSPKAPPCPRRGREYVPAWRSGPYAILITLLSHEKILDSKGFMTKADLQHAAQPLCDASFTRPDPGSHYTAWSSMSQLVKKGFVNKCSNPAKFSLTDDGRELAKKLEANSKPHENESLKDDSRTYSSSSHTLSSTNLSQHINNKPSTSQKSTIALDSEQSLGSPVRGLSAGYSKPCTTCISPQKISLFTTEEDSSLVLDPGTFDIILLVDTCETAGAAKKRHDQTLAELSEMKVNYEVRRLAVGDFLWIARSKTSGIELVLPYVVERKRMDDFGASVKDRRFHEQKFRLKQSGIQNLIYLVESHGSDQHVGLPLSTLQQAAVNTQVVDGFTVKHCADHHHSMTYLSALSNILRGTYLGKTLLACSKADLSPSSVNDDFVMLMNFKEFSKASGKVRTFLIKEMFMRHLLQLKGLSVEKAQAIVSHYPTPTSLVTALCDQNNEHFLASINFGSKNRNIGPAISKALYHLYSKVKLQ